MKITRKKFFAIFVVCLALAIPVGAVFATGGSFALMFVIASYKMWQGGRYFKSLSHTEKEAWVNDALALLQVDSLKGKCIGAVNPESDLFLPKYKKVGVIRIDVCTDRVHFMWLGGFDHTGLFVSKDRKSGRYKLVAGFNDYKKQEIYPEVKPAVDELDRIR